MGIGRRSCADSEDVYIIWRELDHNPVLAVSLAIVASVEQIITGFAAPVETRQNRCQ